MTKPNSNRTQLLYLTRTFVGVVLLFLFLFGFAADLAAASKKTASDGPLFESSQSADGPYHGFHFPFGSKPALPGPEGPEENEIEEEIDSDEDVNQHIYRSLAPIRIEDSSASLQLRHRTLFQDYPGVSLIILYHSWKSYLS
jgi:hypothetical protein